MMKGLLLDKDYSDLVHLYPQLPLVEPEVLSSVGVMTAEVSVPVLPSSRTATRVFQPRSPRNSHREPVTRHHSTIRLTQRHLRVDIQRLLSSDRGPNSAQVGKLLGLLLSVPQLSPVPRGPQQTQFPPSQIRIGCITPSLPQPDQPLDQQIQISLVSILRLVIQLENISLVLHIPDTLSVPHLTVPLEPCSPQPMEAGELMLTSTRLSTIF